jgi:hypothetical protein
MLLQEIQFPTPGEVILDCRQPISVAVTKDRGSKFRTPSARFRSDGPSGCLNNPDNQVAALSRQVGSYRKIPGGSEEADAGTVSKPD